MTKTIFRVLAETIETRTNKGESWTEREILNDYYLQTTLKPQVLKVFTDREEAQKFYDETEPDAPYEASVAVGYVLEYEVIILEEIKVDDEGEYIETISEDIKTKGKE